LQEVVNICNPLSGDPVSLLVYPWLFTTDSGLPSRVPFPRRGEGRLHRGRERGRQGCPSIDRVRLYTTIVRECCPRHLGNERYRSKGSGAFGVSRLSCVSFCSIAPTVSPENFSINSFLVLLAPFSLTSGKTFKAPGRVDSGVCHTLNLGDCLSPGRAVFCARAQ
jgi:hypothetical protein